MMSAIVASDDEKALNFLRVLGDHYLLEGVSSVSFGTAVHRDIASMVLDRCS